MKKIGIIKRIFALLLVFLISINSFAAVVSDNDGSAFITKAEFDSLKNNFQSQIDSYNQSIDSKIDGAIASYLAGISLSGELTLFYDPAASYTFANSMRQSEQKADAGIVNLQHDRLAGFKGCTGASASAEIWKYPSKSTMWITSTSQWTSTDTTGIMLSGLGLIGQWSTGSTSSENSLCVRVTNSSGTIVFKTSQATIDDPGAVILAIAKSCGFDNVKLPMSNWKIIIGCLIGGMFQQTSTTDKNIDVKCNGVRVVNVIASGSPSISSMTATIGRVNSLHNYTAYDSLNFGRGWGFSLNNSIPILNKWYDTISILNTAEIQNFTYKDGSGSTTSSAAWNDTSTAGYSLDPNANFNQQQNGTKQTSTSTATSASTYHRFLASQLKVADNTAWSNYHQLGTNSYESTIRCFNEDCTLAKGGEQTIGGSTLKFNRTGYYMSGGALQTKTDNYVTTGDIKYKNLIWDSTVYDTNQVKLDSFSSIAGENVFLGGGVPLAQSPTDNTNIKVKLDYEVKKLDGSALTSADGNMNIKLEISNKQFSNGSVASGAVSHDTFTKTVTSTTASGNWESAAFNMDAKAKLWLNAYVTDKQGYNVIIKNINVQ